MAYNEFLLNQNQQLCFFLTNHFLLQETALCLVEHIGITEPSAVVQGCVALCRLVQSIANLVTSLLSKVVVEQPVSTMKCTGLGDEK